MNENERRGGKHQNGVHEQPRNQRSVRMARRRRRRRMRFLCCLLTFLLVVALVVLLIHMTVNKSKADQMSGTWVLDDSVSYQFDGHGNGSMNTKNAAYAFTYEINGEQLTLDFQNASLTDSTYAIKLDGDTLTLTGGDGTIGGTYEMRKQ